MAVTSASSFIQLVDAHLQGDLHEGVPPLSDSDFQSIFLNPLALSDRNDSLLQVLIDYDARLRENQFSRSFQEEIIVDLDWRFSNKTIKDHFNLLKNRKKILFIGVPTVFFFMKGRGWQDIMLVDRNPSYAVAASDKRVHAVDIRNVRTLGIEQDFDAVVIDPPWYLNDVSYWTWVASRFVNNSGIVISNIYPPNIRPDAQAEIQAFLRFSATLFGKSAFFVSMYNSPQFEREVFLNRKVPYLENWRKGLSFVFSAPTEKKERNLTKMKMNLIDDGGIWERRVMADGIVEASSQKFDQSAGAVSYGFLDSVSTRHPAWPNIVSVNSRNFVGTGFNDTKKY